MSVKRGFWLLTLLSASCAVRGFTIDDHLPGGGKSTAGEGVAGSSGGPGGAASQGGNGASGAVGQGGKAGSAGSMGEAGSGLAEAGEPAVGEGGAGGAAPSTAVLPCDLDSTGQPPLLCDDFDSGAFANEKWLAPPVVTITAAEGPHGATKLVHLTNEGLPAALTNFPQGPANRTTVSFWLKLVALTDEMKVMRFGDRSGGGAAISLVINQKELGWTNVINAPVPDAPTQAMVAVQQWVCVDIQITNESMLLRYQSSIGGPLNSLTVDNMATAGIDADWQGQPMESRFAGGYPSFGGLTNGVGADIFIDDVRIASDTSSVCSF